MKLFWMGVLLGLAGVLAEARADEVVLKGGQEVDVVLPARGRMMKVYLPTDYSTAKTWPVIFFYHGMNGTPTTSPIREFTGGQDFVIVGMPYAAEDEVPKSSPQAEAILQKEIANFRSAREWVGGHVKMDEKRVILGGISMGGWATSTLGEYEAPRLAGMFILLAGRQRAKTIPKEASALQLKPVYVGAGEMDPNLIPALKAAETYRKYGAAVTYEIFRGVGHSTPGAVPPRFKVWLESLGRWRAEDITDASRAELDGIFKEQLQAALAGTNALARYNALQDVEADPRLARCGAAVASDVHRQVSAIKGETPGKEEFLAEKTFFELSWQDTNMKTVHDLKMVRDSFRKLGRLYPQTFFGDLAVKYSDCLVKMYDKAMETVPGNQTGDHPSAVKFPAGDGRVRPPAIKYK